MKSLKKVTLFHDLSSFGRCALSVITPVIAAYGMQPVQIPTALLSTHTGGFENYTMLDLTDEMEKIINHHNTLGIVPDLIYSGFLGDERQIDIIKDYIDSNKSKTQTVIIDPVMADDGKLYSSYNENLKNRMRDFIKKADIITPNITEAYLLLGKKYIKPPYERSEIEDILTELFTLNKNLSAVIITSVELTDKSYGIGYIYKGSSPKFLFTKKMEKDYPGSGDLFTAVICGELAEHGSLDRAVEFSLNFTSDVISRTINASTPQREGLLFEDMLYKIVTKKIL